MTMTKQNDSVIKHEDGIKRCFWCGVDPVYVAYHDDEWGVPEYDDRALFEKLVLDGFQAGLSWITILRKRTISAGHSMISSRKKSRATRSARSSR